MPLDDTPITDDYVASLLSSRAEADDQKYKVSGIGAFRSPRARPQNAPKPNARFLKNLIRDTDSHNNALIASEAEKGKEGSRALKRTRRVDDIPPERASKRKFVEEKPSRWATALGGLGSKGSVNRKGISETRWAGQSSTQERMSRSDRGQYHKQKHDDRKGDQCRDDKIQRSYSRRTCLRSTSPSHPSDRSNYTSTADNSGEGVDSDPLADVIGPTKLDHSRPRGRGAHKSSFDSIDARFAPDYDPRADVSLNDDAASVDRDDWDMALEALRDRQRYKSTQEDRLKAAGFSEKEIDRWRDNDGSAMHDEEDLRWKKKGEAREWDRGKADQ